MTHEERLFAYLRGLTVSLPERESLSSCRTVCCYDGKAPVLGPFTLPSFGSLVHMTHVNVTTLCRPAPWQGDGAGKERRARREAGMRERGGRAGGRGQAGRARQSVCTHCGDHVFFPISCPSRRSPTHGYTLYCARRMAAQVTSCRPPLSPCCTCSMPHVVFGPDTLLVAQASTRKGVPHIDQLLGRALAALAALAAAHARRTAAQSCAGCR